VARIAVRPEILATYHYNQWVISVTHLFVLGWIGSVVMGAMYQLVPIALETHLHSGKMAHVHFWMHAIGAAGMVVTFWKWNVTSAGHFGSLLSLGVGLFAYNIIQTLRTVPKWNVVAGGIAASLFWLLFGIIAGLYVIASKCWGFSPFSPVAQMHAHAHLGVVGFYLQMMVAVSYKLIPMFTLSDIQNKKRAWWSLGLIDAGLLASFFGVLLQTRWKWIATLVTIAGFVVYAVELIAIIRTRKRKVIDSGVRYFVTAVVLLVPVVVIAVFLSWPKLPALAWVTQLENLYGFLALAGVLTLAIVGMLYKIISFLVWYGSYSREIGKSKTPSLTDLYSARMQTISYWIFLLGLVLESIGIMAESERQVRVGAIVLCVSFLLFIINVALMLSHLFSPRIEPLVMRTTAGGKI
jgi:cbb3-type cytochrome oxidase subunit 1